MLRHQEPELMDDPNLDPILHREALRGLARLNELSGSASAMLRSIEKLGRSLNSRRIKILDIATGRGDIPLSVWKTAQECGLDLQIDGCDVSPLAVEEANLQAQQLGSPSKFFILDALNEDLPAGYDIVTNSLFLHHLTTLQAKGFLRNMKKAATHYVIVNDLVRSYINLLTVFIGSRFVTPSPVVHSDGVASVKAAYTIAELKELAQQAELEDATVKPHFPCRMILTWRKKN
jgi:2-polyprenyl-3-methyl-5-hydroxy-6-metoxy-1,4-benzoquinol methylase